MWGGSIGTNDAGGDVLWWYVCDCVVGGGTVIIFQGDSYCARQRTLNPLFLLLLLDGLTLLLLKLRL